MKIKFKINGMRCKGCANHIKLTMEEHGFTDVRISRELNAVVASIAGDKIADTEIALDRASAEMPGYSISDLMEDFI